MKIASRILLPILLLGASVALAQETPAPAPSPAAAPSVKTIDVSFRGTLRDALKRIAEDGGINVVATGELDTSVEVHLKGVTAAQALRTIARTYSLRLDEDGSIFTLRPMTAAEKESAEKGSTASAAPSVPAPAAVPPAPPVPAAPPMATTPPLPPLPPVPPGISVDDLDPSEIKERVRKEVRKVQRRTKGARDVSVRGQSLEVKEGEAVDNAVVYGGNLVVKGTVEQNAVVFGGNMDVYGTVEGDATAFGGNVVLHPNAVVEGNVASMGGTVIRDESARVEGSTESFGGGNIGALVAGEVKKSIKKELHSKDMEDDERDSEGGLAGFILKFAALFGLGFLGQLFFPNRMKDLSAEIKARPFKSGLTGLLGMAALVPITVVLCITLIGIPVAVVLLIASMLVTALGLTAVASELGLKVPVLRGRKTQAVVLALGLLVLLGLGTIPVLGAVVMNLASLVGFGAAIRTRFGNRPPRGIPEPLNMSSTVGV
jgi:hypothetical protein